MAYEQYRISRQKVRYNSTNDDNPLVFQLIVDGAKVTPTSATITIYRPGSTTALVSAASMTKTGTLLTYACTTTTTASWPKENGYRADIVVTYSSKTYDRTLIFDVVPYILDLGVGFDQLVALDDTIRGMMHDSDSDFSNLIESCRAIMQTRIESRVLRDEKLIENMILDASQLRPAFIFFCHAQNARNNRDWEAYESYKTDFEVSLDSVLATIKYDDGQSGHESSDIGGLITARLSM